MSLDVYLTVTDNRVEKCPHCGGAVNVCVGRGEGFSANITHNLGKMADKAGIYEPLWRPDEVGITRASQLIEPLEAGLARMKADPAYFKQFDASNGWGTYDDFVPWIERYLAACKEYPDAEVSVSR